MLKIRYDKSTMILSAWRGDVDRNIDRGRSNEAVAIIDSPIPGKEPSAWLYDKVNKRLTPNNDYKEPMPTKSKIEILEDRIAALEQAP